MSSKRTKRSKQELDLFPEKNNIKKGKERLDGMVSEISDSDIENNDNIPPVVTKAPKRKKKNEGGEQVPRKLKRANEELPKIKPKKRKTKSESVLTTENGLPNVNGEIKLEETSANCEPKDSKIINAENREKKVAITWPTEDISALIDRMEGQVPERDALAFRSRVEKLNWESVAFKNYTGEECKKTWIQVQKRVRTFRLLGELLNDARVWLNNPRNNHKAPRPKRHPDMPRRPLSSHLLFYLKKKDQIISENPGMDMNAVTKLVGQIYKTLPPEKKEKYEKLAASNKEEYTEKVKVFFENHPELQPPKSNSRMTKTFKVEKDEKLPKTEKLPPTPSKPPKLEKPKSERRPGRPPGPRPEGAIPKRRPPKDRERPPQKFLTPFGLYFTAESKNIEPGIEKGVFRERCKEQYKQMPDEKKVVWINLAEQDLIRYQEELKAYKARHPEYQEHSIRPVLTKKEKIAKERASGKPTKPPNSAYALFSRALLQSDEIKSVHFKERMNYIANKWKNCSEEEQSSYKDQVTNLMENYRQQWQAYLDTLPAEERKVLEVVQTRKRRGRSAKSKMDNSTPIRQRKTTVKKDTKPQPPKLKFTEPEQPPISACKYFASLYKGEGDAQQVWKGLLLDEKRKYEEELVKKKQAYIVEFEKFLKSLSPEELEAFSKLRQQQAKSDEESSECSSDWGGVDDEEDDEGGEDTDSD